MQSLQEQIFVASRLRSQTSWECVMEMLLSSHLLGLGSLLAGSQALDLMENFRMFNSFVSSVDVSGRGRTRV
ncbi:hypothetical protein B0H10DRAFT_2134880 [Mycena sp. CBHHK59/15]|nr:hypothetical protein B0H10DRAFT_2134880 [Mycena sp. CBHHK59/15]